MHKSVQQHLLCFFSAKTQKIHMRKKCYYKQGEDISMNEYEKEKFAMKWVDVTETFSERERHYKKTYLEIDEVFDNTVEVSLFSSFEDDYEIYISYGKMYGIVYAEADQAYELREEIKKVLEEEYRKSAEPTGEFINAFAKKYNLCLPNDIFFDESIFFGENGLCGQE